MPISSEEFSRLVESVWAGLLGLELSPGDSPCSGEACWTGRVRITGAWEGRVEVTLSAPLARSAAALMFGMELEEVGDAEIGDAVGELANITGGNVKALLPGPSSLSTPQVEAGLWPEPTPDSVCTVRHFHADGSVQSALCRTSG